MALSPEAPSAADASDEARVAASLLFESHLALVSRFRRTEFYGLALEALWDAAQKFTPGEGCSFASYASVKVRYARISFVGDEARQVPRGAYKRGVRLESRDWQEDWHSPVGDEETSGTAWQSCERHTPESLLIAKEKIILARVLAASALIGPERDLVRAMLEETEQQDVAATHEMSRHGASRALHAELVRLGSLELASEVA